MPSMTPISASELAGLQADMAATLDKTCAIYAPVTANDAYASSETTWPTQTATSACGMSQPSAGELQNYDYVIGDKAAWTVRFPIGTNVVEQAHLVIEGQTLEVQVLLTPRSYPALLSVIAVEIK